MALKGRGLRGVKFVVIDDHPGLKAAIREVLTEVAWQRCNVQAALERQHDPEGRRSTYAEQALQDL
jgi:transposase-like protein